MFRTRDQGETEELELIFSWHGVTSSVHLGLIQKGGITTNGQIRELRSGKGAG
jgi:hypothetical protein